MTKYFSYGHEGHEMVTMTVTVMIIIHRDHSEHYFQDTNIKKYYRKNSHIITVTIKGQIGLIERLI